MARGAEALARDLQRWAAKLDDAPSALDVLTFTVARAIAQHLVMDIRPDVTREVGGRTLSAGRGGKGYKAGVWAAPHRGSNDWWVGGSGKLHWLDLGTDPHVIQPKRRKRGKQASGLMLTPEGPRFGPFRHPGSRGSRVYQRAEARHEKAAMNHGADVAARLIEDQVMFRG